MKLILFLGIDDKCKKKTILKLNLFKFQAIFLSSRDVYNNNNNKINSNT